MAEDNSAAQRQTAVTAYFQLLLFVFAWRSVCQYSMAEDKSAARRQTAVTCHFSSKQLLLFVFARGVIVAVDHVVIVITSTVTTTLTFNEDERDAACNFDRLTGDDGNILSLVRPYKTVCAWAWMQNAVLSQ